MATYCTNCGKPLTGGAAFCSNCGAAAASSAAPAPAARPARAGASPLLKILMVCGLLVAFISVLLIGGVIYAGYRVKRAVEHTARANGIDLSAFSRAGEKGRRIAPCSLLTREEATQILGLPVERAEASGETCNYFVSPASDEQRRETIGSALSALDRNGSSGRAESVEDIRRSGIEGLTKAMVASANDGSAPYLMVTVTGDGGAMFAGTKLAMAAMGGSHVSESLSGIGDGAILGPMDSTLVFIKNGIGVQIDLRQIPNGRATGIALAKRMLPRM